MIKVFRSRQIRQKYLRLSIVGLLLLYSFTFLAYHSFFSTAVAQDATQMPEKMVVSPELAKQCLITADITGAIGPATLDFIERAQSRVESNNCGSLLLNINTPGGNLQTTRLIVEKILNSKVPILCLVSPSGAHAGSAGAIILLACHLSGAFETSNIGAATPISGTGEKLSDDLRNKMVNDTVAWVESLARLRGRNEKYAKDIVAEAKSVTAKEALELKAIEHVGTSVQDFIKFANNKRIKLNENTEATIRIGEQIDFEQDLRFKVMDLLMNPQIAYLIFMGSLGLLYYELTHPGVVAPGVVGAVGLVISLISLHMMDVTWGSVLLIVLGIGFMVAEAFVAGFGILGVGGIISFFVGSLFLFDAETGYVIPLTTILPTILLLGAAMMGLAYLAYSTRKLRKHGGTDDFLGRAAKVVDVHPGDGTFGYVEIDGELWKCTSTQPLKNGDIVYIKNSQGLTLYVSHESRAERE
jgi:membrane-bound serine protease (ClpP class)